MLNPSHRQQSSVAKFVKGSLNAPAEPFYHSEMGWLAATLMVIGFTAFIAALATGNHATKHRRDISPQPRPRDGIFYALFLPEWLTARGRRLRRLAILLALLSVAAWISFVVFTSKYG